MDETHQQLIIESEIARVRELRPFAALPRPLLESLLTEAPIAFFRPGVLICHPETTSPAQRIWIVRQGLVQATALHSAEMGDASEPLAPGSIFPLECALDARRPRRAYAATEDCFAWLLEGPLLARFLGAPAVLRWVAERWLDYLEATDRAIGAMVRSQQLADQALALPVRSAGSKDVTWLPPTTSLHDAAALMAERHIGSVIVGAPDNVLGILTQGDLVRRGMARGLPASALISEAMTENPSSIDDTASILEAGSEMARLRCRHLLMHDTEGHLTGVVSERDLFRIQQQGVADVFRPIGEATDLGQIVEVSARIRELTERVFRQGMEVSQFARLLSSINDRITGRLLSMIFGDAVEDMRFCWLSFGSEGREEQGFVTDQDNGIIFAVPEGGDPEALRGHYLSRARRMNEALASCGFTLCKGNIMAGNPEWCLSLDEWKGRFSSWIRATTPTAVLNSTIFFDFRPLHGDLALAEELRDHLFDTVKGNTIFLHILAKNALDISPPVGRLSRFSTSSGEHKGTIDLKTQGTRLFVDVARIYALGNGVRATNTEQRLRVAGERIKRPVGSIEGDVAAFRVVQRMRLMRQLQSIRDDTDPNRIDPYQMNEVDQRTLREAFRQVQNLQDRLRLDYQR